MEDCIEEPTMYFYGEGLGAESLVGNDGKVAEETKSNNTKPSAPKMFFFGQPGCLQNSPVKPLASLTNKEEAPIKKTFSLVDYETDSSSNSNNQTEKSDGPEKESDKKIVESENSVKESVSAEEEDDLLDRITKALESDEETKIKLNETKNVTPDRPFSNVKESSLKTTSLNEEQANSNHKSNDTVVPTTTKANIDNDNKESILPAQENVNINLKDDTDESMSNKKNEELNKEEKEMANMEECKIKDNTQITSQDHATNESESMSKVKISDANDDVLNLKNESPTTSIKHDNSTEISIPKHETPANIQKIEDNIKNILETSQQIIAKFPSIDNSAMDATIESSTSDTLTNDEVMPVETEELDSKLVEDVEEDTPNSTNGQECPSAETEMHEDTKIAENVTVNEDSSVIETPLKDDETSEITEEAIISESSTKQEIQLEEVEEEENSNKTPEEVLPSESVTNQETPLEVEEMQIDIKAPEEENVIESSSNQEISLKTIEEPESTVEVHDEVTNEENLTIDESLTNEENLTIEIKQESTSNEIEEVESIVKTPEVTINEEPLKEQDDEKCVEIPEEMTIDESSSQLETPLKEIENEVSTIKTPEEEADNESSSNQEIPSENIEDEVIAVEVPETKINESLPVESKQDIPLEELEEDESTVEAAEELTLNESPPIVETEKINEAIEVPTEGVITNDDSSKQEVTLKEVEKSEIVIEIPEVVELSENQTKQDEDFPTTSVKEPSTIVEVPEVPETMNNGIQEQSEFKTMSEPENSFNDKDAADSSEMSNMESENIESSEVSQHVIETNMDLSESLTTKVNEENSIAHETIESSENSECYNDGPETSEAKHEMKTDSTESITTNENEEETTNVQASFTNETVEAAESQNATYETTQQKEFQNPPETYRMFETLKEANPKTERMRIPIPLCTPKSSKIVQAPNYTQNVVDSMHQQHREAEELSKAQELNESNDNCNQMEHQSDHTLVLNESNDNCNQMEHQTEPTNELIERKEVEQIVIPEVMTENNNQVLNKVECAEQSIEENVTVEQKNIEEQSNNNEEPECSVNVPTLVIDDKLHEETTEDKKEEDLLETRESNEVNKRSLNLEIMEEVPDKEESNLVKAVTVSEEPQEDLVVLESTRESSSVSAEQVESMKEESLVVPDKPVVDEIKPTEEKIVHISDELDEISSDDDREESFGDCNRYDEDEDDRERSPTPPAVEPVTKEMISINKNDVEAPANDLIINEIISEPTSNKIELEVRESTPPRPTAEIVMKNDVSLPEINKSELIAQKDDIVDLAEDVSDEETLEETNLTPEPIAPKVAQEIKVIEPSLPIEIATSTSVTFIPEPEKEILKQVVVEQQNEMLDLSKTSREVLNEKIIESSVEVSPTKVETPKPMETTEIAEDLTKPAEPSKSLPAPSRVTQNLSPKKRMTLLPISNRKRKISETRLPTESDSDSLSDRPSDSVSQDTEDDEEAVSKKKLKLRTKNPKKIVRKNAPTEINESINDKQEEKLIVVPKIDDVKPLVEPKIVQAPIVEPKIVQAPVIVAKVAVVEQVKVEAASSSEKVERKPVRAAARKAMDEIKTLDKPATQTRQKRMQVEAKAEEVKATAAALVKEEPVKVVASPTKDTQMKVEEKPISPVKKEDVVVESKQRKAMSVQAKKEEEKKELLKTPVEPQPELKVESIETTDEKVPAATSSTKQDLKFDYDANEDVVANVAAIKSMMTKEVKTEDDEENEVSKKRGRKSKRGRYARKSNQNDGSSSDEDAPSSAKGAKKEGIASKTTTPKKKRETGPKGLLRHIDTSLVIDTNDETPVRMSRRIAQQKIREETDRRQMEEKLLKQMKAEAEKKKKGGPESDNEKDKNYEKEEEEEEEEGEEENSDEAGAKEGKKRKKTKILPSDKQWQTSSSASEESEQEEEDYMEHIPSDHGSPLFRSDHEFSPESDDETDQVVVPIKRARTAKKVVATEASSDYEDVNPIHACQVCHKTDSPEWILLCDQCDHGYHCSCLTPIVFLIPSGNWFCPLCCHKNLVEKLSKQLIDYDSMMHAFKLEEIRKQRQTLAEISAENIIEESQEAHRKRERSDKYSEDRETSVKKKTSRAISYSSNESSGSSSDDEPLNCYKLRKRNQAAVPSYRFNDYDDLINSAIRKDMASKVDEDIEIDEGEEDDDETHAGNAGRGKDIATIIEADKEEKKQLDDETIKDDIGESKGKKMETRDESSDDSDIVKPRKYKGKKKSRKLNNLDISSEEDRGSDEDFKGASSSDSDEAGTGSGDSESSLDFPRRKGKKGKSTRRSTRTRQKRVEERFIDDNSSDDEPLKPPARKIKKRTLSEEEEFDVNDDDDEDGSVDEEIDSEDLCDDTETSDSSNNGWPKKKKKRTASYDIKPVKKVVKRTDDEDKAFRAGISKKKILKESLKSDAEDDKEGSDGSESAKGKRKTRGKKLLYLIEDDLESSDDGIKPGVKRPDTPPEERELFIKKQEEIKRMLAAKNTEGAKQLAAPKIGRPQSPPPLISGESSSLSTVPKQFIESAKALDLDYRIKPQSSMVGASKMDMNPNDMNEEELARMMEEEDFAQHQLKLAGEAIARKKLLDLETKVEENFAGFKDSNRKDKPEPKKRSKKQKVEVKPIPGSAPTSVIATLISATTAIPPIMISPSKSSILTPHPSQQPPLQLLTTQTENLSRPNPPPLHSHPHALGGPPPSTVSSAHHGPTTMPSQIFGANPLFAGIVPRHPSVISSHYPPTPEQLLPLSYHQPPSVHHPSQAHQLQQISPESDSKKRGRRKKFTPLRTDLPAGAASDVIRSDKSALPAATPIERMDEKVKAITDPKLSVAAAPQLFSPATSSPTPSVITRLLQPQRLPGMPPYGPEFVERVRAANVNIPPSRHYGPPQGTPKSLPRGVVQSPLMRTPNPSHFGEAPFDPRSAAHNLYRPPQPQGSIYGLPPHTRLPPYHGPGPFHHPGHPGNPNVRPGMQEYQTPPFGMPPQFSYYAPQPPAAHRRQSPHATQLPPSAIQPPTLHSIQHEQATPPSSNVTSHLPPIGHPHPQQHPANPNQEPGESSEFGGLVSYFSSQQELD